MDPRAREYAEHQRRTQAAQARAYAQAMQQHAGARAGSMEARYDPRLAAGSRAAAGMQMTDGSVPMGAPPSARRVHFDPSIEGTRAPVPRPVPPRVPMTDRVTGSGPQISAAEDPLERSEHLDATSAAPPPPYQAGLEVVTRALQLLLLCLLAASVFVLPERARVLWLTVAVTATLATVGARLFEVANSHAAPVADWMVTCFYVLLGAYALVTVIVLATAAWRAYKTLRSHDDEEDGEEDEEDRPRRSRHGRGESLHDVLAPKFSFKKSKKHRK